MDRATLQKLEQGGARVSIKKPAAPIVNIPPIVMPEIKIPEIVVNVPEIKIPDNNLGPLIEQQTKQMAVLLSEQKGRRIKRISFQVKDRDGMGALLSFEAIPEYEEES